MLSHTAAMSITGLSDTNKLYAKSFHRWKDSGELDVFEAARYFSGATHEVSCHSGTATTTTFAQKVMREELQEACRGRGGRASLDLPMMSSLASSHTTSNTTTTSHANAMDNQMMKEKIKYKQPSSPAGRLASFLNSLFSQANSKKKKKSKSTTQSLKDEDESPSGRRRRRSSISHFRSASTADSKSIYSSSSSGFRTPPSYAHTPTKITAYKDLRSYSDHKQVGYSSVKYNSTMVHDDKRSIDLAWLEDKFRFSGGLITEKKKELGSGFSEKCSSDDHHEKDKILMRKLNDQVAVDDDGADSDSSSDLFELQNYDLGNYYPNDLPVYETTHIDSIKRGAPISTAAI